MALKKVNGFLKRLEKYWIGRKRDSKSLLKVNFWLLEIISFFEHFFLFFEILQENEENQKKEVSPKKVVRKPKELSISEWIRTNKLSALKLSIMDIFSETIVENKPKKISIGNKDVEVTSKLWDEVKLFSK